MTKNIFRKSTLNVALALSMGISALPQTADASFVTLSWSGYFHMHDTVGAVLGNTSIQGKQVNSFETPVTGTLTLDTVSGAGTATMSPFSWQSYPDPAAMIGMSLQAIGNGSGGNGPLMLGNMLFNWGGNSNAVPVSLVWDASGLLDGLMAMYYNYGGFVGGYVISGAGARSAVDGTYVGTTGTHITGGYMDLGAVPMATTTWNTTPTCAAGGGNSGACMNVNPSGALPLVADTVSNLHDYNALFIGGDGSNTTGIAGSPMLAGPFEAYNISIDIVSLTTVIEVVPTVPAPAAVWLLGSGLAGLVGVASRRRR